METVFISHSSADASFANGLASDIETDGLQCWLAPRDVIGGMSWVEQIVAGIERCAAFVLILTEHANRSDHVVREVQMAIDLGKPIVALRDRRVEPRREFAFLLNSQHWILFDEGEYEEIRRQLRRSFAALITSSGSGIEESVATWSGEPESERNVPLGTLDPVSAACDPGNNQPAHLKVYPQPGRIPDENASEGDTPGEGSYVEYEFADWTVEWSQTVRQFLVDDAIPHVWEAGRLTVPKSFEERTDALVDKVIATITGTLTQTDSSEVVFDVSDLNSAAVDELTDALEGKCIDWRLGPDRELVVSDHHAVTVESIFDRLEIPDAISEAGHDAAASKDHVGDTVEGDSSEIAEIDVEQVLGGLFIAVSRLARDVTDPRGVLDALVSADELTDAALPFGFDPTAWGRVQDEASGLALMLRGNDTSDEEVEAHAARLRDSLRHWAELFGWDQQ